MGGIAALILSIAVEYGLPPYFVLSIALEENRDLYPLAVHYNDDGSIDKGIMQLNSTWYKDENWSEPEANIRAGCTHILWITKLLEVNTWWTVAVVYNAGSARFYSEDIPDSTLDYAASVMSRWIAMDRFYQVVLPGKVR